MSGDRGQALVLTAALLGVAAVAIVGLRGVSDRMLDAVRDERAGEAAAAAAGVAVANVLFQRSQELGRDLERDEIAVLAADPAVTASARDAAVRLAREHGRGDPSEVRISVFGFEVEVHVVLAGRTHIALIPALP